MNKRTIINIVVGILGYLIGNNWQILDFKLNLEVNIVDVATLIVTIILGVYIAKVLEKEVQDKRIEKDILLSKIDLLSECCDSIENMFLIKNGQDVDYRIILSLEHRLKTKTDTFMTHLQNNSEGKIKESVSEYNNKFKSNLKELRNDLTMTNADGDQKDIEIVNNLAKYSAERTSSILTWLNKISNDLLELSVYVNKL